MIVVSNTSPITNLAAVNQLLLLHQLYKNILIPQAVYDELTGVSKNVPGNTEVQTFDWIQQRSIKNKSLVTALQLELDRGEAEAIALAVEHNADLLLLDERRGRNVAARFGLQFTGILGVLIEAKYKGQILAVKPVLDSLISIAGFWITQPLYIRILQTVGEYSN